MTASNAVKIRCYLMLALVLYGVAYVLPALQFRKYHPHRHYTEAEIADDSNDIVHTGSDLLWLGWLGIVYGQFAWFANVWISVSVVVILSDSRRYAILARLSALVAMIVAANTLTLFFMPMLGDEGGVNRLLLRHLRLGSAFWVGSFGSVFAASLYF